MNRQTRHGEVEPAETTPLQPQVLAANQAVDALLGRPSNILSSKYIAL